MAWVGVSRSTPVSAGILALIYDAYRQQHGHWPDAQTARAILVSGADDMDYDPLTQGAGHANAQTSSAIAAGDAGFYVTPPHWTAGDYRQTNAPGFANIVYAGDDSGLFTLHNPTQSPITVTLSSDQLMKTAAYSFTFTTQDKNLEVSPDSRHRPDYLIDITPYIPPDADLLEANVIFPFDQFDPDGNYSENQRWQLAALKWTDVNTNSILWDDANSDGIVSPGEIDEYEYMRFTYDDNRTTTLQVRVAQPYQRMGDGIFLDLRHTLRSNAIPTTTMIIELNFYQHTTWDWLTMPSKNLTIPANGEVNFAVTMTVPFTAVPGLYNGAIHVQGDHKTVISVVANVAANWQQDGPPILLGGTPDANTPYDNGRHYGHFDWGWRPDAGDWRFFFLDTTETDAASLIVHDIWPDSGLPYRTDIDTRIYGPQPDIFSIDNPAHYGPYTLCYKGGSLNTYRGGGKWEYQTATGGPEEWIAAPLDDGLHLIMEHNVLHQGDRTNVPFTKTVGTAVLNPAPIIIQACDISGALPVTLTTNIGLPGLTGNAYGLTMTQVFTDQLVGQDVYADPATASYTHTLTLTNAGSLAVSINGAAGADLDLYLLHDANEDDDFNWNNEQIAASATVGPDEFITLTFPDPGDYQIAVFGSHVPSPPTSFDLTVQAIQGTDLTLTGIPSGTIPAGETAVTLGWQKSVQPGEIWEGLLYLSPSFAPDALTTDVYVLPCDASGLLPEAEFTHNGPVVLGNTAIFTNSSTGTEPLQFLWDFGDGSGTSTAVNPTHVYSQTGTYTVTLTAENMFGQSTAVQTITVGLPPEAGFTHNGPILLGDTAVFTNTAFGTEPLQFLWDFGDGSGTITAANPTHVYTQTGTYTVTLIVENEFGVSTAVNVMAVTAVEIDWYLYLPMILKP